LALGTGEVFGEERVHRGVVVEVRGLPLRLDAGEQAVAAAVTEVQRRHPGFRAAGQVGEAFQHPHPESRLERRLINEVDEPAVLDLAQHRGSRTPLLRKD
jgi:hypothetical protein